MLDERPDELLKRGITELGFIFKTEQINAFITYLIELKKWNKVYNLSGLHRDEDIIIKHFLDSMLYLKAIPKGENKIADVGSGAGFPGIPIKIMSPDIEMFLIEPSKKKCAFLNHIIKQLKLDGIGIIEKRIEEIKVGYELPFWVDIAVTRALFSIKDFIKKVSHIIKKDGILVLNKGPKVKEELKILKKIEYNVLIIKLPLSDIQRNIVVVKLPD
ncbi:MAG: 16S rRNA (guanine(527)-N(7))-methyltransferase RsmG [Thermodesulfovibrionales bacterium]